MISKLQKQIHETAKAKGWWESERNIGEMLCLIHSEISEALEDWRSGDPLDGVYLEDGVKPCGFPTELADAVIRILDMAEYLGIDLENVIKMKMAYNESRPYRHGGKLA